MTSTIANANNAANLNGLNNSSTKEKKLTVNKQATNESPHDAVAVPSVKTIDFNAIRSRDFADHAVSGGHYEYGQN